MRQPRPLHQRRMGRGMYQKSSGSTASKLKMTFLLVLTYGTSNTKVHLDRMSTMMFSAVLVGTSGTCFPIWNAEHRWALELAEVFSLGRSMWMLLRQPDMDFEEIEHPDDLVTDWEGAEDIPTIWKQMVDRCMSRDPNERPNVIEVVQF